MYFFGSFLVSFIPFLIFQSVLTASSDTNLLSVAPQHHQISNSSSITAIDSTKYSTVITSSSGFQISSGAASISSASPSSMVITKAPESSSDPNANHNTIPGLLTETCYGGEPPCVATCKEKDLACRSAGSSIVATCKPQWDTWTSIQRQLLPTPSTGAWSWFTSINEHSFSGTVRTTTLSVYTKFSTVKHYSYVNVYGSTITPVYALGKPTITESVVPNPHLRATYLTGPTPNCRYNYVDWMADGSLLHQNSQIFSLTCGQCTVHGGEVQLYWWPSPSTVSISGDGVAPKSATSIRTTVINGVTLTSPTVYVSLHNLSASNSCSVVGSTIKQTLLPINPTDVSTLVHIGGKVDQTGANQYGPLNFQHLTGLPPVSEYEQQGECIYAGCPTIYPTPINYTIVVPSQVRSMDPAWAHCAAPLEGLYVAAILNTNVHTDIHPDMIHRLHLVRSGRCMPVRRTPRLHLRQKRPGQRLQRRQLSPMFQWRA